MGVFISVKEIIGSFISELHKKSGKMPGVMIWHAVDKRGALEDDYVLLW